MSKKIKNLMRRPRTWLFAMMALTALAFLLAPGVMPVSHANQGGGQPTAQKEGQECIEESRETNCTTAGSVTLSGNNTGTVVCVGSSLSVTVGVQVVTGKITTVIHYVECDCPDCDDTSEESDVVPSYTITWSNSLDGSTGSGESATIPTSSCGTGTVTFTVVYTQDPCEGGTNTAAVNFSVLEIKIGPETNTLCLNCSNGCSAVFTNASPDCSGSGLNWEISPSEGVGISDGVVTAAADAVCGDYTVTARAKDSSNCMTTATLKLIRIAIEPTNKFLCVDCGGGTNSGGSNCTATATFTLSTNSCGSVTWEIAPSNASVSIDSSGTVTAGEGADCGPYTITARATDDTNCTATATLNLIRLVLETNKIYLCANCAEGTNGGGSNCTASATFALSPTGGCSGSGATWEMATNSSGVTINSDSGTVTVPGDADCGPYSVTARSKDETNCTAVGTLELVRIDIAVEETNACASCTNSCEITLNLKSNYCFGGGSATWTSAPPGISGDGAQITVDPATLTPTTYVVYATSTVLSNCQDSCIVRVLKVDIEQTETNVCGSCTNNCFITLNLTPDSYLGGGSATWESTPAGISGSGTSITFDASALAPTTYVVKAYSILLTNCFDTCTVRVVKLTLTNMTFSGGWDILQDDGSAYPNPHWTPTTNAPYLYKRSTHVKATAQFRVDPTDFNGSVTIAGDGPEDLDFTNTSVAASGGSATYPVKDSNGLLTNCVFFFKPMAVSWRYGLGTSAECDSGASANWVYVCLDAPIGGSKYHSVVHFACSVGGAINASQAVANTWSQFAGAGAKTWDGVNLKYWEPRTATATDAGGLLNDRNGQCGSWAALLVECYRLNGIAGVKKIYLTPIYQNDAAIADPDPRGLMLVKDWTFAGAGTVPAAFAPFTHTDAEITDEVGVAGQNSPNPPGAFKNHFVTFYDGDYFDPSYGSGPFASKEAWEAASIDGYEKVFRALLGGVPSDVPLAKKKTPGILEMNFTVLPY